MSDVMDKTNNVESTGTQHGSQLTEPFADRPVLMILTSVIGFLHEAGLLTNKSLIKHELAKRLPTVSEFDLKCYTTCIWCTAHCLTQQQQQKLAIMTSLPDVSATSTTAKTVKRDNGFCSPFVIEPSYEWIPSTSAVVELVTTYTTCSAVASCAETDADSHQITKSEAALQVSDDDVEQRDPVVSTGFDCVEFVTAIKAECDEDPAVVDCENASGLSVCKVDPSIALNTGDLPVAVEFSDAVTSAATVNIVGLGLSEFDDNEVKYERKDGYISLERPDLFSSGNARAGTEITTDATEAVGNVHGTIEKSHVIPFHDERTVLTHDYMMEVLRVKCSRRSHAKKQTSVDRSSRDSIEATNSKCNKPGSSLAGSCSNRKRGKRKRSAPWGKKKFMCNVCGASFIRLYELEDHERTHTFAERPFVCKVCGYRFLRVDDLQRHEFQFHARNKLPSTSGEVRSAPFTQRRYKLRSRKGPGCKKTLYTCEKCGSVIAGRRSLTQHELLHRKRGCFAFATRFQRRSLESKYAAGKKRRASCSDTSAPRDGDPSRQISQHDEEMPFRSKSPGNSTIESVDEPIGKEVENRTEVIEGAGDSHQLPSSEGVEPSKVEESIRESCEITVDIRSSTSIPASAMKLSADL